MIFNWKRFFIGLLIVSFDVFVYIILGVMTMQYDDFYDEIKGEYGSWASMTNFDKTVECLIIFWNITNIAVILYILYQFFKQIKNKYFA